MCQGGNHVGANCNLKAQWQHGQIDRARFLDVHLNLLPVEVHKPDTRTTPHMPLRSSVSGLLAAAL